MYQSLREHTARQKASATPDHERRIPRELYDKAQNHQDQFTDDEHYLLLSRGDAIGKALSHPDTLVLSPDEVHEVLQWPSPAIVRATGGRMTTPMELYEKAKGAIDNGRPLETVLSNRQPRLLAQGFRASDNAGFASEVEMASLSKPGASHAMALVAKRMGYHLSVFHAAAMFYAQRIAPTLPFPRSSIMSSANVPAPAVPLSFRSEEFLAEGMAVFSLPVRGQREEQQHVLSSVLSGSHA